jgi:hypothetical protein
MDVEEIDEVTWALLIQPHPLRGLKTKSSRRSIPVHPSILSLGFVDFVRERKQQAEASGKPEQLLFPGILMKRRGQVGYNIGRWFSELVDDLKLEGRNLSFHSFRHNFEDALRRALIAETSGSLPRRSWWRRSRPTSGRPWGSQSYPSPGSADRPSVPPDSCNRGSLNSGIVGPFASVRQRKWLRWLMEMPCSMIG